MKIHQISLPTPFPVGDVNIYLIADDPVTLIDVGPKTKEAVVALRDNLRQHNLRFSDVRRIVLTHAHEDHCGLIKTIRDEAKNIEIWVHDWETGHLFGRFGRTEHKNLLQRVGVPENVSAGMQTFYEQFRLLTDALEKNDLNALRDEMELEFATGSLRVLHTPGHTPGSCSFLREANRTLLCGDTVLKRITPNPVLAPDPVDSEKRFQSLGEYLVSLARLRAVSPTMTYGGHGEPITDFEEVFNRYVRAINERQAKVLTLVEKQGVTAWEVANKLFPTAINDEANCFLATSETIAHLDYAVSEGKIAFERTNDKDFFRSF